MWNYFSDAHKYAIDSHVHVDQANNILSASYTNTDDLVTAVIHSTSNYYNDCARHSLESVEVGHQLHELRARDCAEEVVGRLVGVRAAFPRVRQLVVIVGTSGSLSAVQDVL